MSSGGLLHVIGSGWHQPPFSSTLGKILNMMFNSHQIIYLCLVIATESRHLHGSEVLILFILSSGTLVFIDSSAPFPKLSYRVILICLF